MELESVWSGQKGVYVGSGLREMEAYDLRTGALRSSPARWRWSGPPRCRRLSLSCCDMSH